MSCSFSNLLKFKAVFCLLVVLTFSQMTFGQQNERAAIPDDPIGKTCKVQIKTDDSNSKIEFTGKLVRLTDKHLVLDQVTKFGTHEQGVPMLDKVPYVTRLFKNVGIASESLKGKKKISRKQIVAFQFTQSTDGRKKSAKQKSAKKIKSGAK